MTPAARPRATRSRTRAANSSRSGFLADGGGEVGVLVDDDEVDRLPRRGGDLPQPGGDEPVIPAVHQVLQPAHAVQRVIHGRADEPVGAVAPQAELDLLAVDQNEAAVAGQRAVRGDEVDRGGLAAARLAADQQVAFGQLDVRLLAELVLADVHGLVDR